VPLDLGTSVRRGAGERFVVEGDEYNAAYFDRGAKFLHYRPETAIVTSVEYDHADLYPDPESFRAAFAKPSAVRRGPPGACGDSDARGRRRNGAGDLYGDRERRPLRPPERRAGRDGLAIATRA
jgi:hypothetical protein